MDRGVTPPDPSGTEPDYRMSLAAERTYLAYLRTGLALAAGGVGVAGALPHAGAEGLRRSLGCVLAVVGAAVFVLGRRRWVAVDRAMRRGEPLPSTGLIRSASWVLAAATVVAAILVFLV